MWSPSWLRFPIGLAVSHWAAELWAISYGPPTRLRASSVVEQSDHAAEDLGFTVGHTLDLLLIHRSRLGRDEVRWVRPSFESPQIN
jgi:hypothetical protein